MTWTDENDGVTIVEMKASVLYEALKELGKLPKTLKIERITIKTDSVTGKKHKETISTEHALVNVAYGNRVATVDFDKLKSFIKKIKDELISITIDRISLCLSYKTGDLVLSNIEASSSETIDLNAIQKTLKK